MMVPGTTFRQTAMLFLIVFQALTGAPNKTHHQKLMFGCQAF
jgi:hypothetical protein